eukprot:scaffold34157_cov52-Attheya_sp.AAC.1
MQPNREIAGGRGRITISNNSLCARPLLPCVTATRWTGESSRGGISGLNATRRALCNRPVGPLTTQYGMV